MSRAKPENSSHHFEFPSTPPEFGKPLSPRRGLNFKKVQPTTDTLWTEEVLSSPETTVSVKGKGREQRPWETFVLDPGTNTETPLEGRSYTIGEDHLPVDIYIFPPDKPDGIRIGTIRGCRIFVIMAEEAKKKDGASESLNKGWREMLVFKGVSKPKTVKSEEPIKFDNGSGQSRFVYAEWKDIARKRKR